jgi:four helix bundle protein
MREGLDQLEARTKQFAIQAIRLCARLEGVTGLRHVAWQLAAASSSVASNHRAMRRARSTREFAAKLQIVNEEVDETAHWLEIAEAILPAPDVELQSLLREAIELRSIFARARATLRDRFQ